MGVVPHDTDLGGARQGGQGRSRRQVAGGSGAGHVRNRPRAAWRVHEPAEPAAPAAAPAPEAVEAAPLGVDVERGVVVGMERAEVGMVAGTELDADVVPERGELGSLAHGAHRHLVMRCTSSSPR